MINNKKCPLITVITVVFNGAKFIEETILSVINQTYKNVEYIVIDGGSSDGTIDIIKNYTDKLTFWISEPDKGIYDAMNKGIKVANGEWFNFLNAGDRFIENEVFEKIFSSDLDSATLIYGDTRVLNQDGQSYYHKANTLKNENSLKRGMKVCHQAIFYNREILNFYDSSLRINADWKHLIEMTRKPNFKPLKCNFPFVYYRLGGLSANNTRYSRQEYKNVFLEKYGVLNYIYHIPFFMHMAIRRNLKKLFKKLRII